jgi:hypothetical protein
MLIFPMYEGRLTLTIEQPTKICNLAIEKGAEIKHFPTLHIEKPTKILLNRVFTKENTTSSLREISSPFFLQEFRPMTPLKATNRFTSLMVIGMTKIMCNNSGMF